MFYYLYLLYGEQVGWFRVFQYTSFRTVMAALTALLMGVFLAPWFIRKLKERQIGQIVREDGPTSHLNKRGTPTMGGSLILFCLVVPTLLWGVLDNPYLWMVLTTTVGYGIIGFYDDYRKVSKKSSAGLAGRFKLLGQLTIASLVVGLLIWKFNFSTELAFPFARFDLYHLALPDYVFFVLGVLVIVGASNAVNLTDGLDGLAIVPVTINASTFLILAYAAGGSLALALNDQVVRFTFAEYLRLPFVPGAQELAVFCSALIGAGAAFLWYNAYPAQVFMGDVGSLALGGALGTLAVCTKNELLLVIIGGVFVAETISVMLQVSYFKHTKKKYGQGRRIFLMAPLHHHFEKQGWHESKVSVRFWIVSTILALIALSSLKLR